jgi:Fur family ferric uptake transcriptional regulator
MPEIQFYIDALRKRGHKITPQREMIVKAIVEGEQHMTVEEIFAKVQERTKAVNIATVYRTLDLLVNMGLINRTDMGDDVISYSNNQHGPHIHLICRNCGAVINAEYQLIESLNDRFREHYRFEADLQHIAIFGTCDHENCRQDDP